MALFKIVVFLCVLMACVWSSTASGDKENTNDCHDRLANIESKLERILERNDRLEARVAVLEDENKALKESLADVIDQLNQPNHEAESAMTTNRHKHGERIKSSIASALNLHLKPRRQLTAATVAFTAVVSPPSLHIGPGQTVLYDSVITNVGGAYNSNTGIFTAPVSGVYVFNFAEMIDPGRDEYLELVKDGNNVMWNYGHAVGASHLASSSRTATVELIKGNQVWVRTKPNEFHGTGYIHGNTFTTFSGWVVVMTE